MAFVQAISQSHTSKCPCHFCTNAMLLSRCYYSTPPVVAACIEAELLVYCGYHSHANIWGDFVYLGIGSPVRTPCMA